MTHTVEKIGGTSIANTPVVFDNVLIGDRKDQNLYNRMFVVSAYAGITNLLLEHKKTGQPGVYGQFADAQNKWAWSDALTELSLEMRRRNEEVLDDENDRKVADDFVRERIEGVRNCLIDLNRLCSFGQFRLDEHLTTVREMLAGLGEAHSAHNTALRLRSLGVNAVFVDLTGWRDERDLTLEERMKDALDKIDISKTIPIITGYANCLEGMVKLYDRGYTEVTFAHLSSLTGAREAIIHKEFHLSSADPKLVGEDKVCKIGATNYDVADQLSNMGMEAVHPNAAKILRQAGIPLRVKNTFDPKDDGTVIKGDFMPPKPRAEIITGIKSVDALEIFEQDMVGVKGYDAAILDALTRHNIRIISKCSNANTITHYVDGTRKALNLAIETIEAALPAATINRRKVAIVSVIGADLDSPGMTAAALSALAESNIGLVGVQQVTRKTDIQIIVDEDNFDAATIALHKALIEKKSDADGHRLKAVA